IMDAARAILCKDGEFYIAGGVESMTRAPFVIPKTANAWGRQGEIHDTTMGWRFINPALSSLYHSYTMGETAENVAEKWNISREEQDQFAFDTQTKYQAAASTHRFKEELVSVEIKNDKKQSEWVDTDEHPRLSSLEKLAQLKPAFKSNGTV